MGAAGGGRAGIPHGRLGGRSSELHRRLQDALPGTLEVPRSLDRLRSAHEGIVLDRSHHCEGSRGTRVPGSDYGATSLAGRTPSTVSAAEGEPAVRYAERAWVAALKKQPPRATRVATPAGSRRPSPVRGGVP